jgi:uncharacterized tellurite resistance protein B-like protein
MLNLIKELLQGTDVSRRLTDSPPDTAVSVCALLLEAAEADDEFTPEERRLIKTQLRQRFNLDEPGVEALLRETQQQRAAAVDAWPFTHAIRKHYTPEQKRELLVLVWQILLSDEKLTASEEQWARRLHEMLAVNHSLLMDAKREARASMPGLALAPA